MFSDFQNMFDKIKTKVNEVKSQVQNVEQDYANTPQKYTISGREIQQLKLLSQGAFGFIWLAEDVRTKQQFALKRVICMTSERLKESKLEQQVMSIFPKSDYIVKYFGGDVINRNGQKVVITLMELCDGGNLFDMLQKRQNKGFTQQQLVQIILEIAQGLHAIHSTGYYHRDVKIQNVLIGKDKHHKLCDFGSCTKQIYNFAMIHKKQYDSIKEQIQGMTTPMYRPPEIVDPYLKYTVNQKADIWMTGCILYTLAYFTHPFVDSNAIGIASGTYRFPQYHQQTQYRTSQKIKDLIRHLLTPNPNYRPSAAQLINLLRNWNNLNEIPLNAEAVRRKQQQFERQRELERLNKKCVDYDGDIPIQKLMQLQKKLKKVQIQQKPSSFINKKGTQKLRDQNSYIKMAPNSNIQKNPFGANPKNIPNNVTNIKNNDPFTQFNTITNPPRNVKKQTNFTDLWGNNFGSSQNNKANNQQNLLQRKPELSQKNSFDFFDSFGTSNNKTNKNNVSNPPPKSTNNVVNFEEMFAQTPVTPNVNQSTNNSSEITAKNKNQDLIDL